jgi:hypothetical protein
MDIQLILLIVAPYAILGGGVLLLGWALIKKPAVIACLSLVLFGDLFVAHYKFRSICASDSRTAIYERVYLADDFFLPKDTKPFPTRSYDYGEQGYLLSEKLDYHYQNEGALFQSVSIWGPIARIETSFTRKSDGKVISEVVGFRNRRGWLARTTSFGNAKEDCVIGYDGRLVYDQHNIRGELVRRTFCKSGEQCLHSPNE